MLLEVTQEGKRHFLETYKTYRDDESISNYVQGLPSRFDTSTQEELDMFSALYTVIWYKEPRKATRAMMQGIGQTNFKSVPIDMDTLLSNLTAGGVISYDRAKRAVLGLYESLFITNAESEECD